MYVKNYNQNFSCIQMLMGNEYSDISPNVTSKISYFERRFVSLFHIIDSFVPCVIQNICPVNFLEENTK